MNKVKSKISVTTMLTQLLNESANSRATAADEKNDTGGRKAEGATGYGSTRFKTYKIKKGNLYHRVILRLMQG